MHTLHLLRCRRQRGPSLATRTRKLTRVHLYRYASSFLSPGTANQQHQGEGPPRGCWSEGSGGGCCGVDIGASDQRWWEKVADAAEELLRGRFL